MPGIKEVQTKLEILDEEFQTRYDYNPIHHIESRLKSPKSILHKVRAKGLPMTYESIRENVADVAGVRVICNYIDDIYRIADLLTGQDDVQLVRTRHLYQASQAFRIPQPAPDSSRFRFFWRKARKPSR